MTDMDSIGLCEYCLALIPVAIHIEADKVLLRKKCSSALCPGAIPYDTPISYDPAFFQNALSMARERNASAEHRRYNAAIVEVTSDCDIRCATCIANTGPGGTPLSVAQVQALFGVMLWQIPPPEVLMVSGGEPTTHPQIISILQAARQTTEHLMMISNGLRISRDVAFATMLGSLLPGFEVYLQFDSLTPSVLKSLRGFDLSRQRVAAVEMLDTLAIPTTLIVVVKKGLNDKEVGSILRFALAHKCIRGVTFQPVRATGRHTDFQKDIDRIDIAEIRREVIASSGIFEAVDLIPHPVNPLGMVIGYALRTPDSVRPVTRELFGFSCEELTGFRSAMYFLPKHRWRQFNYDGLFRVAIVGYLDKYTFLKEQLNCCNLAFATPEGLEPFDTHYFNSMSSNAVLLPQCL